MLLRWIAAAWRRSDAVGAVGTCGPGLPCRDGADDVDNDARAGSEHNVDRRRDKATGRRAARRDREAQGRAGSGATGGRAVTWTQLAALVALVAYALPYFICARPRPPGRQGGDKSHSKNQAVPIRHRLGKPDRPA